MKYTISRETLLALAKIRRRQCKQTREAQKKAIANLGPNPTPWDLKAVDRLFAYRLIPQFAFVRMVHGQTVETALPVSRIEQWARIAPQTPGGTIEVATFGPPHFCCDQAGLMLSLGFGSSIKFFGRDQVPGKTRHAQPIPAMWLGEPIVFTAPAEGGEFTVNQS